MSAVSGSFFAQQCSTVCHRAMAHFDRGVMEAVRASLELVPGASLSEGNKAEHSNLLNWSPKTELSLMHRQFLRAATLLEEQRQTNHRWGREAGWSPGSGLLEE